MYLGATSLEFIFLRKGRRKAAKRREKDVSRSRKLFRYGLVLAGLAGCIVVFPCLDAQQGKQVAAQAAEEMRNNTYGFSLKKPVAREWKIVPESQWKVYFDSLDRVVGCMVRFKNPEASIGGESPQMMIAITATELGQNLRFDDGRVVAAENLSQLAKHQFEILTEQVYKDPKNVKETDKTKNYPNIGKMYQFSFYGMHRKYGNTSFVKLMYFKGKKHSFQLEMNCPTGDEKLFETDLDQIFRSVQIYKPGKAK